MADKSRHDYKAKQVPLQVASEPESRSSMTPVSKRIFGVLGDKKIVVDPDWAKPQENMDAWLAGDV